MATGTETLNFLMCQFTTEPTSIIAPGPNVKQGKKSSGHVESHDDAGKHEKIVNARKGPLIAALCLWFILEGI